MASSTAVVVAEQEVPHTAAGESTPLLTTSHGHQNENTPDEDHLPKAQVALLCLARLIEPIAFFSVFPYINQMVQDNGNVADTDVGFYSGVIESLFSLTQALVMLAWGRAADRVGRKPVLVLSLVGMASATALFGTARTLGEMIAFRCLAGVFSGTIVTIRTMLAEHSTPATQARVFSWFAFSGNMGIFLGPLLGGALADPYGLHDRGRRIGIPEQPDMRFFAAYPYALPGFAVAGLGFLAALSSALYIEETLVKKTPVAASSSAQLVEETTVSEGQESGLLHLLRAPAVALGLLKATQSSNSGARPEDKTSIAYLIKSPGVAIVLYNYAHVMLLAFAYTAIVPVFWFTPVELGGLGFTPLQISIMMGVSGAGQAAWLLFVFPPLQHRMGTNGVMRACAIAYPVFIAVSPMGSWLLRYWDAEGIFWACVPPVLVLGSGVSMCFTAVQLAVNDVAPSPQLLGTLNALALTGVSMIRAFTPALFTSLYAVNARTQALGGYAIWVLLIVVALGYTVSARYLPDYDEIKRQRGEEE